MIASLWNNATLSSDLTNMSLSCFSSEVSVQPAGVPEAGASLLSTSQSPRPASQPEGEEQELQRRMKRELNEIRVRRVRRRCVTAASL